MRHSRTVTAGAAALALSFTLAGCSAKNDVAAPDGQPIFSPPAKTATTIFARSLLSQTGIASFLVPSPPAVIVLDQNGLPMSDVDVLFVVMKGEGSVAPDRVRTDRYGIARTSWRLGSAAGENTLTANVSGIQPLPFSAKALVPQGAPSERATKWDLVLIGGQELPITYSAGSQSWTITGGHYLFLDDSTYAYGYDVNGIVQTRPMGRYLFAASGTVQFYDQYGALFSTGTIQGNVITVTYEDSIDFDIETYVFSSTEITPPGSARAPSQRSSGR